MNALQMDLFDLTTIAPLVMPEKQCLVYCGERCDCSRRGSVGFEPVVFPPVSETIDIDGWVKTRTDGKGLMPVPTLIQIPGDACTYRPARFRLAERVTVARWPSGDPALYFGGERIPLFTAVERGLAKEIK